MGLQNVCVRKTCLGCCMEIATLRLFMCELLDEAGFRLRSAERYGVKLKMSRRMFMWRWRSDLRY